MSIRKLDWSPLDLVVDPVVHADPDVVSKAQQRYAHIAQIIDDANANLAKIVETNSESLAGKYVQGLKHDAGSLKDSLSKAVVRYHDVANEIAKYEPDLASGLSETAGALQDAEAARADRTKAQAMPDPQKSQDGTTSPEEKQKGADKDKATSDADAKMAAAKQRLNTAVDALARAGKRFGDAVNSKKYNDGLTDSHKDKLDAVMAQISKIFAIVGMVLAVLAILIPGVDVLVLAGVAVSAVSLAASVVLYKDGKGSIVDVVLGAVGLGLAGLGSVASLMGKGMSNAAKISAFSKMKGKGKAPVGAGGDDDIEMVPLKPMGKEADPNTPNFSRPLPPSESNRPLTPSEAGPSPSDGGPPYHAISPPDAAPPRPLNATPGPSGLQHGGSPPPEIPVLPKPSGPPDSWPLPPGSPASHAMVPPDAGPPPPVNATPGPSGLQHGGSPPPEIPVPKPSGPPDSWPLPPGGLPKAPVPNPPAPAAPNAATAWQNQSEWFNNPATNWVLGKAGAVTPDVGFWPSAVAQVKGAGSMWGTLATDPAKFGKDFASIIAGVKGPQDLSAVVKAGGMGSISPLWYVWGGLNGAFGMGGLIYTGGRLQGWIPDANPPRHHPSS
ncbi:hypothetical protein AB5J72_36410 [Streptomyces sp. CG1]|uniref:hypothetical protein n=1 Tax=Streptomyces sp. CG1 TaxID=1287523 RepID=UPI0034E26C89